MKTTEMDNMTINAKEMAQDMAMNAFQEETAWVPKNHLYNDNNELIDTTAKQLLQKLVDQYTLYIQQYQVS